MPPISTAVLEAVAALAVKERARQGFGEAVRVSLIARRHMSKGVLTTKRLTGLERQH